MSALGRTKAWLRAAFARRHLESEMHDEMAAHLEQATERHMARGLSEHEARLAARREFGNVGVLQEDARDARGARWLDVLTSDLKHAAVRIAKRRRLTALFAASSLGVGMALATSVFTMVDTLVLREPFRGSNSVFRIEETPPKWTTAAPVVPARHALALADDPRFAQSTAVGRSTPYFRLGASGEAASVPTVAVGPAYFRILGVNALLGRTFDEGDALTGAPPAIVISYSLWQSRFAGARDVIDHPQVMNGTLGRIVGVMPREFDYPTGAEVWSLVSDAELRRVAANPATDFARYYVLGRIAPGQTIAALEAEIRAVTEHADGAGGVTDFSRLKIVSLRAAARRDNAAQLTLWIALSVLVVTLCGVNLATMSLAEGIRRRHEIAVRAALGASSRRLAGMLVADVAVVAALAGVIALVASIWMSGFVRALVDGAPSSGPTPLSWTAPVFAILGTIVVGVLFVLGPSFELGRADLRRFLAADSSGIDMSRRITHGRTLLVGLQMALAVLGVASVVAIIRADRRFGDPSPGYDVRNLISATLLVRDSAARASIERPLLEVVRSQPGVRAATVVRAPDSERRLVSLAGRESPWPKAGVHWVDVAPDFFATIGIRPIAGRLPDETDVSSRAPVAVLSEQAAAWMFGRASPLGRRVKMTPSRAAGRPIEITIVGVVPEIRRGPDFIMPDQLVYTSWSLPVDSTETKLLVRVAGEPGQAMATLRRSMAAWDSRVVIGDLRTKQSEVDAFQLQRRGRKLFLNAIAVLALLLAGIGVYGITQFITAARAKEMAVRRALGARGAHVLWVAMGNLGLIAAVGAVFGGLAASPFAQIIDALVRDPMHDFFPVVVFPLIPTVIGAAALFVVAVVGAFVPVRRLLGQDVATTLR